MRTGWTLFKLTSCSFMRTGWTLFKLTSFINGQRDWQIISLSFTSSTSSIACVQHHLRNLFTIGNKRLTVNSSSSATLSLATTIETCTFTVVTVLLELKVSRWFVSPTYYIIVSTSCKCKSIQYNFPVYLTN